MRPGSQIITENPKLGRGRFSVYPLRFRRGQGCYKKGPLIKWMWKTCSRKYRPWGAWKSRSCEVAWPSCFPISSNGNISLRDGPRVGKTRYKKSKGRHSRSPENSPNPFHQLELLLCEAYTMARRGGCHGNRPPGGLVSIGFLLFGSTGSEG